MKKGLLSILAGALLVVGCQNYDDQFDALETQINALASTVAGLSQVQSDLASLAGTVNSLQSALSAEIDTALADGLADIDAAVAELEAATADVASAEDVANIQSGIDANTASLDELLAQSAVFQGNVTINSKATLDVYHSMGDQLAIVNGNVDIDAKADMDAAKLQETVDFIRTTVGSFDYQAASSSVATVTFLNLTGTQTLTISQAGDYRFDNLSSATNIRLFDQFKSKVKIIHFGELTSVSKFFTDTASSNLIDFNKVQELHLTKLAYYPPNNLTIRIDEGSVLATAIDDVDADGDQSNITLSIEGPASFSASNLKDGSLTFKNVATVTVNGFEGAFTLNAGVENFNADKVTALTISGATDLANLNITGSTDPDVTTDKTGPEVTIEDNANIETVTLAGKVDDVVLEGNGNLTTVTISAEVDGKINIGDDDAAADGNSDLTSITLTGAKATSLEIANNSDLESVTVDVAYWAGTASGAKLDGELIVVNNASLTSLNVSSDKIEKLTVTGNDDLATVDFSGLAAFGATGKPVVNIWDNDLEGSMNDTSDGDTDKGNGKSGDLGSVSSASGIKTLKTYLTAVAGDADSTAKVLMDTVDFTNEAGTTTEYTYATSADAASEYLRVLYITPNTAASAVTATKGKRSFLVDNVASGELGVWANGVEIFDVNGDGTAARIVFSGNDGLDVATILDTDNVNRASGAGVTLTARDGGNAFLYLTVVAESDSRVTENSGAVRKGISLTASDVITMNVGGITVTTTITQSGTSSYADAYSVGDQLINAWNTKHTASAKLANFGAVATATAQDSGTGTDASVRYKFTSKDTGSGGVGHSISVSVASSDGTTTPVLPVMYGTTTSTAENTSDGDDLIITLESKTAGVIGNDEVGLPATGADSNGTNYAGTAGTISFTGKTAGDVGRVSELYTNYRPLADIGDVTSTDARTSENRDDVTYPEDGSAAAASNEVSYSRVGWL